MKTIIVKTTFKGWHKWADAPESVAFLRNSHRHLFTAFLELEVFHNDREVEFFTLQEDLETFIQQLAELKSCEWIAEQILKNYENYNNKKRYCKVQVWEDMENGATVDNKK